jgi:Txe/YoeB family toxin of Txe-Axe toxin-antitoxin module
MELLPSQKVKLYEIISQSGFNTSEFEHHSFKDYSQRGHDLIAYMPNTFFHFLIGFIGGEYEIECSPVNDKLTATFRVEKFDSIQKIFINWLDAVKRESKMIDVWEMMMQDKLNVFETEETKNSAFTDDQIKYIKDEAQKLIEKVSTDNRLDDESKGKFIEKIKYDISTLGETTKRIDWQHILLSIAIEQALDTPMIEVIKVYICNFIVNIGIYVQHNFIGHGITSF